MSSQCPGTVRVIEEGIANGLHAGVQLFVSVGGETVADLGIGELSPGRPMTNDAITLWMSSGKPVAAIAIAQLWEAGRLGLDNPVAEHVPEFARNGKDKITIRHLLTHTGGFRAVAGAINTTPDPWVTIIARICAARPEPRWVPGEKAGYHIATSWFILGEIIRRLSGKPFDAYVRDAIFLPLGLKDSWVGMPESAFIAYGDRIAPYHDSSGLGHADARKPSSSAKAVAVVSPGGNARGPIRELGLLYECLRLGGTSRGTRLLSPQTVEGITARHRVGLFDLSFNATIDWGLGFICNSSHYGKPDWPYNFGPHASPRTYGHSGNQSSCAFCDPEHGLVVAWTCNGFPGEPKHQERQTAINTVIYEDLGLAESG